MEAAVADIPGIICGKIARRVKEKSFGRNIMFLYGVEWDSNGGIDKAFLYIKELSGLCNMQIATTRVCRFEDFARRNAKCRPFGILLETENEFATDRRCL